VRYRRVSLTEERSGWRGLFDTYLVEPNGAHGCLAPLEVTVAEELIAFAFRQQMPAKSKQFWTDKTQFIDVHLTGGTGALGHGNPEVAVAVTAVATIAGREH
jgi:hypothetical protein